MISMGGWVGFGPMVKPIWNTQIHLKHPNAMPVTFQARSFQSLAPAKQNAKVTFHLESLKRQNDHFVRAFLQIPHFQLENRRFRASFSFKAIFTELKKYDFCEASATFQDTHQMLRLPRYLQECHVRASLPLQLVERAPSPRHKMLRLPRHRERPHHKVLRLPRKNDALALTRFQSIAPVTQNAKMTSHFVTCERQNEIKRAFRARLPLLFTFWR